MLDKMDDIVPVKKVKWIKRISYYWVCPDCDWDIQYYRCGDEPGIGERLVCYNPDCDKSEFIADGEGGEEEIDWYKKGEKIK